VSEVIGCQQIEIYQHRSYVALRITLENGTDVYRVYAAGPDGLTEYDSVEEFQEASE
jgi:hypothetical protein